MNRNIVYLDLFSGLGSFAKGLQDAGFVFKQHYFSEIDEHCIANYRYNFKKSTYVGDINKFGSKKIDRPDIVTFGSPCQDLSLAGRRAGLQGRKSNLFFRAIELIERYRPRVFVFENVAGLFSSNKGKDFEVVLETIAGLGLYECQWQLVNTAWFLPQNRERIYLVGCLRDEPQGAVFPLDVPYEKEKAFQKKLEIVGAVTDSGSQTCRIFETHRLSPALMVASGFAAGYLPVGDRVRRLTPLEGERLQGLPDNWTKYGTYDGFVREIADTHRYDMIGNAVSRPIVTEIGKALLNAPDHSLNGPANTEHHPPKSQNMITARNYFSEMARIGVSGLSEDLAKIHRMLVRKTKNGKIWAEVYADPQFKKDFGQYLKSLNAHLGNKPAAKAATAKSPAKKKPAAKKKAPRPKAKKPAAPKIKYVKPFEGDEVGKISEELRFIKRYVLLDGRPKTFDQIRAFLNGLQKAMTERRIRKTSKLAAEIMEIQDALIKLYERARISKNKTAMESIAPERKSHYLALVGKERLLPSVRFIKTYIGLQGKVTETPRLQKLLNRIEHAKKIRAISSRDPYISQINDITARLDAHIKKNPSSGTLFVSTRELNGLSEIVEDLEGISGSGAFHGFAGFYGFDDSGGEEVIVRGSDLAKMSFPTLGFRGKWREFIGDPTPGFTAMVFGRPKYGKSALCIELADYLSKNHGEVLYVAREENLGGTLQDKMNRSRAYEVNYTHSIPADLSPYDFVFLDSITKLGLTAADLDELRAEYPGISFVFIFQTTKQGAFRGSNGYQHDVDIVIEIPEIGQATQYGRFNQGGTMDIF